MGNAEDRTATFDIPIQSRAVSFCCCWICIQNIFNCYLAISEACLAITLKFIIEKYLIHSLCLTV